ncbi:MAG: glycosyltransferase [Eubacterium sp.]|nr:glycosyltransferase [Eubacterium sp.]
MNGSFNGKVSIVIPIYNVEKYLRECIDSVLAQTYENIEVICVDDGSEDDSYQILSEYKEKDSRIITLKQNHMYAGVARNYGFEVSNGEYVIFLDADDVFHPELIEKIVNRAAETDADIVIYKGMGLDDVSGQTHRLYAKELETEALDADINGFSGKDISKNIFQLTDTWVWDKLYKSSFIREKKIKFQDTAVINDAFFCCLAYAEAGKIAIVDEYLMKHRTSVITSVEYTRAPHWKCTFKMLEKLRIELESRNLYKEFEQSYINLAAERVVFYAMSIAEGQYFHEAFSYYRNHAKKTFGFMKHSKEYFHNEYVYEKIKILEEKDEIAYLSEIRKENKQGIEDRDRAIRYLEGEVRDSKNMAEWLKNKKRWTFPAEDLPGDKRIAVYGFGDVGQDFCKEISAIDRYSLVGVIDKNAGSLKETHSEILFYEIEDISRLDFDVIIIAIINNDVADKVKEELIKRGIGEDRIKWFNYLD